MGKSPPKATIVLADDHHIVRGGLRALLSAENDLRVVGEAGDGLDTLRVVERLKPDVLVLDLMMPGLNGLEVIRQIKKRSPKTRTVVLSMHKNEAYVWKALNNGAAGYVLKESAPADLVKAVREALVNRSYLSPPLSETNIMAYLQKIDGGPFDLYETLTARERQILQLSAEGQSSGAIGERLSISSRTVEAHRANLMRKLGLHKMTELVRYSMERQLVVKDGRHSRP
ncbi:MAG: response regulator transcription factor [Verrucomicrobia bacterium]|nr:MAG: response regulator transcription factor [Verrucomicrobiota bacterium]